MKLRIAAIIVTWNKKDDVCFLIEDVSKLSLSDINLDVFVVDNASNDGTQCHIESNYPYIKVLETGENLGGSGGFSHGLAFVKELQYDYIWLLDNDVRLSKDSLFYLVQTLKHRAEVGLVGSQIRKLENPSVAHEIGINICEKKAHLKNKFGNISTSSPEDILDGKPYLDVDVCSAASLLVRSDVVNQIGLFENYFLHFDDVEWCLRARKSCWVVAANPNSIVFHPSPESKQRPWIIYYDERNLLYCWLKHRPELLLKRIRVLTPKLILYTLTGRHFLVNIYFQAFNDFLGGVKGKSNIHLLEYEPEDIVLNNCSILIDSKIYKEVSEILMRSEVYLKSNTTIWQKPSVFLKTILIYLSSCFYKQNDIGIFSLYKPKFWELFLVRQAYFFTGTGFARMNLTLKDTFGDLFNLLKNLLIIYYKMSNILSSIIDNKTPQ